ncbi:dihydrodipicolinate synthase family protein [Bryobacter aggregatus]|uniref:dihydrodipicolinate synthase family protein n=1 Tax=Bryobacter aggregatus TaxID=360054 RepID=UPI0004E18AD7|nr:dihydrodipicolinate synthase family protein [Bryobacter aggregatus]
MNPTWHGVYPALTTQFRDDESIDFDATAAHLDKMIASGIHGVILLGSVGENTALSYEEKMEVLRAMKPVVNGRIPLLSGVAENTTRTACRYAAEAERIGIDGLMVLPAMIYKADRREALTHFRDVAHASSLPIMIYNNPPSYFVDLTTDCFLELAEEKTLVAIKESSGDPRRITDLKTALGNRYILFSGVDDLVVESALLGAQGWVSGLVNAFPDENRILWEHCVAGRWTEAIELYRWYTPLLHLDTKIKLVQYIKMCMAEVGLGSEKTRAPRLRVEGAEREQILGIIRQALATRPKL